MKIMITGLSGTIIIQCNMETQMHKDVRLLLTQ